ATPNREAYVVCRLLPIEPRGFVALELAGGDTVFDDLPWFLDDLRPAGFLGRAVPARLAAGGDRGFPDDIGLWSADVVLRYLHAYGWDGPGQLVLGQAAFQRYLVAIDAPPAAIPIEARATRYTALASRALGQGDPGSSAAGEQPKFLAVREEAGQRVPVLVKFSPPTDERVGRRL